MKVFATAGPIAKECAKLLTRVANMKVQMKKTEEKKQRKVLEFWIIIEISQV